MNSDSGQETNESLLGAVAEEFFSAADRGEQPSLSDFAARYPQIGDEIRNVFPMLELVGRSHSEPELHQEPSLKGPRQLGDYRLLRELGRGGMGVVYEAEQISISRRVAIKLLPFASLASEHALKRFQNEIRTAASLEHPNIAAVYASGEDRGVHYFAMQLIRGRTLADVIVELQRGASDAKEVTERGEDQSPPQIDQETIALAALSTVHTGNRRSYYQLVANLAVQACDALHYAHSLGVVHRDIKPSNLIVDLSGRLWLTDFGLALGHSDVSLTKTGNLIGTLRYMSPEQLLYGESLDLRTDIYAMGATVYEMLALAPAFGETDRGKLTREILEDDPEPLRSVDARIPWELGAIVAKAMAKDAADRYQSALELADDLRAFSECRPIKAKPVSFAHRISKYAKRNRRFVITAFGVVLLLALVSSVSSGLLLAERERTYAASAEREAVLTFLVNDLLAAPLEEKKQDREVTVGEVLDNAEVKITEAFRDQPAVEATVRQAMARSYLSLSRFPSAEVHSRRAMTLRSDMFGPLHRDTLESIGVLAQALTSQRKTEEARELCEESYRVTNRELGDSHEDAINAVNRVVEAILSAPDPSPEDIARATKLCEDVLPRSRDALGQGHRHTLTAMKLQADLMTRKGRIDEAQALQSQALTLSRASLGAADPLTLSLARIVGDNQADKRLHYEAAELYKGVLDGQRRTLGIVDDESLNTLRRLAFTKISLHEFEEGRRLSHEALDLSTRLYGPEGRVTLSARQSLNYALRGLGRNVEAARLQEETVAIHRRVSGNTAYDTVNAITRLAYDYIALGRDEEALVLLDESYAAASRSFPDLACQASNMRAHALRALGKYEEAIAQQLVSVELYRKAGGGGETPLVELAFWSLEDGDVPSAKRHFAEAIRVMNDNDWYSRNRIAWVLATCKVDDLRDGPQALELAKRAAVITRYEKARILDTLAAAEAEVGNFEAAIKWAKKAVELADSAELQTRFALHLKTFEEGKPYRSGVGLPKKAPEGAPAKAESK